MRRSQAVKLLVKVVNVDRAGTESVDEEWSDAPQFVNSLVDATGSGEHLRNGESCAEHLFRVLVLSVLQVEPKLGQRPIRLSELGEGVPSVVGAVEHAPVRRRPESSVVTPDRVE